jgi:hypothetical protein
MTPGGQPDIEMYVVYAMNHKLRAFPEFAAAIGMDLVSDCASARRFLAGYDEYASSHPLFDADEPLAQMPVARPLAPDTSATDDAEVQKVYGGDFVANNPVVRIRIRVPSTVHPGWQWPIEGGQISCSGTFINKNWILTAAHCITPGAVYHCLKNGTAPEHCQPAWDNYNAPFTISGTEGSQSDSWSLQAGVVRGYAHPNYLGRDPLVELDDSRFLEKAVHDLALLYVPSEYYGDDLPPNVEQNGAMRLSLDPDPDVSAWEMQFYGWGAPAPSALRRGTMIVNQYSDFLIRGVLPPGDVANPFTCSGDSGGPLVRSDLSLHANSEDKTEQEAIVGVLSGGYNAGCELPTDPDERRVELAKIRSYWVRIDERSNARFIKETLTETNWPGYASLNCTPRKLLTDPSGPDAVEECWGTPCKRDADCKDTSKVCSLSAQSFRSHPGGCAACDRISMRSGGPAISPDGCNCIVGHCVPRIQ